MRKRVLMILVLFAVLTGLLPFWTAGPAYGASENGKLTITEIEDLPAVDIEENAVPLAAGPGEASRGGMRHAAMMGLVLAGVTVYVWYFSVMEKRLFALRKQAAEAEIRQRERRRAKKLADADGIEETGGRD